jgi:hypothetical protein
VSQDGFDFEPPPPRRETRRFEPPPWERAQFERHAREQAERERAEREAAAAAMQAAAVDAAQAAELELPEGTTRESRPVGHQASVAGGPSVAPSTAPAPAKEPVDEKHVTLMMLELRAQEPPPLEGAWKATVGAGVVVTLVGIVIGIWGAVAFFRLGSAAGVGGAVLVGFGFAFAGIGGWLVFRALRQRGVL